MTDNQSSGATPCNFVVKPLFKFFDFTTFIAEVNDASQAVCDRWDQLTSEEQEAAKRIVEVWLHGTKTSWLKSLWFRLTGRYNKAVKAAAAVDFFAEAVLSKLDKNDPLHRKYTSFVMDEIIGFFEQFAPLQQMMLKR